MLRINLSLFTAILILSATRAQDAATKDDSAGKDEKRRAFNKDKQFSLIPPPGWDAPPKTVGANTILARQGGFADGFGNVNARAINGSEEDMVAAVKPLAAQVSSQVADYKLDEEGFVTIGGRKGYRHSFTFSKGNVRMGASQYMLAGEGKVYIVTFTLTETAAKRLKLAVQTSAETMRIGKP